MSAQLPIPLPTLRQDLSLQANAPASDGSPTWTIYDPSAHQFYQLTWPAFEILSRWSLTDPQTILDHIHQETTLHVTPEDLTALIQFLTLHHLIETTTTQDTERFTQHAHTHRHVFFTWLLHHYLFFRLPLFQPARLLDRLAPYVTWGFDRRFWYAIIGIALLGLYFASRQWDTFTHAFTAYTDLPSLLVIGIALTFAKIIHEFGHALAAQRYGCRVPTMGIAFLVLWPVLYTDTNDSWKLPHSRPRFIIAAAGMLSELALAAIALFIWNFLPDGALRTGIFLLATSTWILTLTLNASPFMRFDGYFLLSDWLNLPNLHERAFAFGRWWLREHLLDWQAPPPETLPPSRQRLLIAFAWATWIYRFFLFLGIALLVYHFTFKLLGIILGGIELGWFIIRPIYRELRIWWQIRSHLRWTSVTKKNTLIASLIFTFFVLPWHTHITAPAMISAAQSQSLYAPSPALVMTPPLPAGTPVTTGQILVQLDAPELTHRFQQAQLQANRLRIQLEHITFDPQQQTQLPLIQEQWQQANETVKGLQEQIEQLTLKAPFNGVIVERNDHLIQDAWVTHKEKLFQITGQQGTQINAFLNEQALTKIQVGDQATFIHDHPEHVAIHCTVNTIDPVPLTDLTTLPLASLYGGPIVVEKNKQGALIPTESVFHVHMNHCTTHEHSLQQELRGVVHIQSQWHSEALEMVRRFIAGLQREIGL